MKKKRKTILRTGLLVLVLAMPAMGCDYLDTATTDTPETTPTASISVDNRTVRVGSQVTVNGGNSSDPQGETLTYAWTMPEKPFGSSAALSSSTDPIATFVADSGGYYTVMLLVTNVSGLASAAQTVRVDAIGSGTNHPPVASAGSDQTASIGSVAILDASASSDADQDPLSFSWSLLSAPTTSTVTAITDSDQPNAFLFPDVAGDYVIKLKVSDGQDSDLDFITITAS